MSFIGDVLSTDKGAGFQASGAPIDKAVNTDQTAAGYQGSQNALGQQQAFLNALQSQGGLGHQSSTFGQMSNTANMLGQMAQGNGPSPAQDMLRQSSDQAMKEQAGAVSSTKGLNPAMAAQMASQQGAQMQQGAANQAAQLKANQQLGAIGALQGQQANMANLANQQVAQQQNQLNSNTSAQQNAYQQLLNQINAQNQANVGMQGNINSANSGIANTNAQGQQAMTGGLFSSAGQALFPKLAHGGMVEKPRQYMAEGGLSMPEMGAQFNAAAPNLGVLPTVQSTPSSAFNFLSGGSKPDSAPAPTQPASNPYASSSNPGAQAMFQAGQAIGGALGKNAQDSGKSVLSMLPMAAALNQGGEVSDPIADPIAHLHSRVAELESKMGSKKMPKDKNMKSEGGHVPGKATVKGDSLKNDTVPAMLSPGEVVIPRSVMSSQDPASGAAKFVEAVLAKHSMKKSK